MRPQTEVTFDPGLVKTGIAPAGALLTLHQWLTLSPSGSLVDAERTAVLVGSVSVPGELRILLMTGGRLEG